MLKKTTITKIIYSLMIIIIISSFSAFHYFKNKRSVSDGEHFYEQIIDSTKNGDRPRTIQWKGQEEEYIAVFDSNASKYEISHKNNLFCYTLKRLHVINTFPDLVLLDGTKYIDVDKEKYIKKGCKSNNLITLFFK